MESLEEYRADLEEEDMQERKKTKTKSKKVRRAFIASLRRKCSGTKTFFHILAARKLERERKKMDKEGGGLANA